MKDELKKYIQNWKTIDGIKPKNEKEFIYNFLEYLLDKDKEVYLDFHGDGAYFGKEIAFREKCPWGSEGDLDFEVAYDKNNIAVYRGDHEGYWVPEYVSLKKFVDGDFEKVFDGIRNFLLKELCIE